MLETTVRLDDKLMKDAERLAAATGRSLDALLEDALRDLLSRSAQQITRPQSAAQDRASDAEAAEPKPFKLPTFSMGPLPPGVSLDNNASFRDYLDSLDPGYLR